MYIETNLVSNIDYFESVKDYATCSICLGIVSDPHQCSKCENCYCKDCIFKWKKLNNNCPLCKDKNTEFKEASRIVKNMISKINFKCPNEICSEIVAYDKLIIHNETCGKDNPKVICPMCKSQVDRSVIDKKSYDEMKAELEFTKKMYQEVRAEYDELLSKGARPDRYEKDNKYKNKEGRKWKEHPNKKEFGNFENNNNRYTNNMQNSNIQNSSNNLNNEINLISNVSIRDSQMTDSSNSLFSNSNSISKSINLFNQDLRSQPVAFEKPSDFKFDVFNDDACVHERSHNCPIFECCGKAFPCKTCHNQTENHKRGKIVAVYCKRCYTVNQQKSRICLKCGENFRFEKYEGDKDRKNKHGKHGNISGRR